ncbi:MAG: bestrophin family ion channel [Cyclobacteriaceae bacterium]
MAHRSPVIARLALSILLILGYYVLIHYIQNNITNLDFVVPGFMVYVFGYVIALLFYFRLGNSYYRWYDGLKALTYLRANAESFSMKVHGSLKGNTEQEKYLLAMMINFYRSVRDKVRGIQDSGRLIPQGNLPLGELTALDDMPSGLNAMIEQRINSLYTEGKISWVEFLDLSRNVTRNSEHLAVCEALQNTPPPKTYIIHLRGFVLFYAGIIPFGFIHELGVWMMLFLSVFFYFYTGMEIISEEVEDPFGFDQNDLPVNDLTKLAEKRITQIIKS